MESKLDLQKTVHVRTTRTSFPLWTAVLGEIAYRFLNAAR
jgi:hypothetical protein